MKLSGFVLLKFSCSSSFGVVSEEIFSLILYQIAVTPCSPTMVTPYFNTMPGNGPGIGATPNSSVMSHFSHDSSSIIDGADICTFSEPYGHHTSSNFVNGYTFQFFPYKEEFVNNLESGFSECHSDGASQMVFDRHVRLANGISEKNSAPDASSGSEFSIKCEIFPSDSCVKPYNSFDGHPVDLEPEQPYKFPSSFQDNKAVHVKVKPELELENLVYSSVPGIDSICSDVHTVAGTRLQWSGVSNSGVSYQTDVGKEYSFMAPQTPFPGQDIDSRSFYKCFDSDDCLQCVAGPEPETLSTEHLDFLVVDEDRECNQLRKAGFNISSVSSGTVEILSSERIPQTDDDSDICKIESKGESVNPHQSLAVQRSVFSSENCTVSQTFNNCGGLKLESNKGNMIFQAALQVGDV